MTAGLHTDSELEETMRETGEFFFERAEKEQEAAERKREAAVTKATTIATLAVALPAIVAAPAFDLSGSSHGIGRWLLLGALLGLLASIGCAARSPRPSSGRLMLCVGRTSGLEPGEYGYRLEYEAEHLSEE